jgi:hypothetical protein
MRRLIVPVLMGLFLFSAGRLADSGPDDWLVQKVSGTVTVAGAATRPLKQGILLSRGTILRSGDNGKALLVRGKESIFIGPNTVATIARNPSLNMSTTIVLQSGSASFKVQKKSRQHFSVETPFLAAVVKGTSFTVTATRLSAGVSVHEGLVEVRALKSGQRAEVSAGQNATVNSTGDGSITLADAGGLQPTKKASARTPSAQQPSQQNSPSNQQGGPSAPGNGNGSENGKKNGWSK